MPPQIPSSKSRRLRCQPNMPTFAPVVAMATVDGGVSDHHLLLVPFAGANRNSNRLHLF
ncbi:hypothetical protein IG631_06131 [Alternaria alternata]|nr:hypothetical protein IG631_06131 [Alternaria alternata]